MKRQSLIQFFKAMFTAQVASVVDFCITFLLANLCSLYYVYATFLGSVSGGVVNCCLNYRWVFDVTSSKIHVAFKYFLVWAVSLCLNTYGTFFLTEMMNRMAWVSRINGVVALNLFLLPKIVVSLLVAFLWNYQMQRKFVYRAIPFNERFSSHK